MEEKSKVPRIRFKGFTDDWKQRKLGDNIIEYHEITTKNNQYPPLTSSRKGIFLQTDYFAGNQIASADNTGYNIVPYGYFTYRHMSDDKIFHFNINDIVENGIVSTLYPVFTTDKNLDSRYLQYQLNYGYEFAKYATLQKQGGSRTYMYLSKLKELKLTIPNTVQEQKKISEFFIQLDNLITLHQHKYDKLVEIKKSLLEKMFPKDSSKIPDIRFKGFTDNWELRKLGDVGTTYSGLSGKAKEDFGHGNGQFITYMNVFANPVGLTDMTEAIEIDDSQNKVLFGDVFFTTSSETPEEVGMSSVWLEKVDNTYLNSFCFGYRPTVEFNPYYLAYMLRSSTMRKKITFLAQGISRYNISKNKMMDIEIPIPSIEEQKQIGSYFSNLDNLITLHQRKLEKLKEVKKSMLEKMFI